jgi:alanine dehydrogenase
MSRIAGRLAPLVGGAALATDRGGAGVLLPGVDAIAPAKVVVLGAGNVGSEAAFVASRLGCAVCVFSRGPARLAQLARRLADAGTPIAAHPLGDEAGERFVDAVRDADLVIGGVLEPGRLSPKLLSRELVASMRRGSALVDVGIDQGGIAATSRMTKLSEPTYVDEGVVHYCVPNMPALVARTATLALTAATLPYVQRLAAEGFQRAMAQDAGLAAGLMIWDGAVVHQGLARDAGLTATKGPGRS